MQLDKEVVLAHARGRWAQVFDALAPELDAARRKPGRHVDCPVHGGKADFRLFRDWEETGGGICTCGGGRDGIAVLRWLRGWSFPEALREVAQVLGLGDTAAASAAGPDRPAPRPERTVSPAKQARLDRRRRRRMMATWNGAHLPSRSPEAQRLLRAYARSRGLDPDHAVDVAIRSPLRVHPGLGYWTLDERGRPYRVGCYPAIVAAVEDVRRQRVTLHRTYLAPDGAGKAPVEDPKKMMTPISSGSVLGAAIRLDAPRDGVLGLAEGLETALAVSQATGIPTWATISASVMAAFEPPEGVRGVVIWADSDRSEAGQQAASDLAERLGAAGYEVAVRIPRRDPWRKSVDWLDVLLEQGQQAFPRRRVERRPSRMAA